MHEQRPAGRLDRGSRATGSTRQVSRTAPPAAPAARRRCRSVPRARPRRRRVPARAAGRRRAPVGARPASRAPPGGRSGRRRRRAWRRSRSPPRARPRPVPARTPRPPRRRPCRCCRLRRAPPPAGRPAPRTGSRGSARGRSGVPGPRRRAARRAGRPITTHVAGAVPAERAGPRGDGLVVLAAQQRVDDQGLQPGVPGSALLGGPGVDLGGGEGDLAGVPVQRAADDLRVLAERSSRFSSTTMMESRTIATVCCEADLAGHLPRGDAEDLGDQRGGRPRRGGTSR